MGHWIPMIYLLLPCSVPEATEVEESPFSSEEEEEEEEEMPLEPDLEQVRGGYSAKLGGICQVFSTPTIEAPIACILRLECLLT